MGAVVEVRTRREALTAIDAGAGIVADSVPAAEFAEARNKAAAAVRAVQIANRLTAAE